MKKCPKCGTILDDSKKKCYMCGTELSKSSGSFADNFDIKIGAKTTKGQDNVFNNGVDIKAKGNEMFGRNQEGVFFSNNSTSSGVYQNSKPKSSFQNINPNLNSVPVRKPDNSKNQADNAINDFFKKNQPITPIQKEKPAVQNTPPKKVKQDKIVLPKEEKKNSENSGISFSFIFNTLCFIVFLGLLLFVYVRFIKPKTANSDIIYGKLHYVMSSDMKLSQDNKDSKYYTHGESCAIKISYGETNDIDGFVDSYFDQIQDEYRNDNSYLTQTEKFKINGNTWSSLSVLKIDINPASSGGVSKQTKYKYISIVYDNAYYNIVYANIDDDNECSNMYEDFVNTLEFEK